MPRSRRRRAVGVPEAPDVNALASQLFGEWCAEPGVHRLAPDARGFVWYAVVGADGTLQALSVVPDALATREADNTLCAWHDSVNPSPPPALSLVR